MRGQKEKLKEEELVEELKILVGKEREFITLTLQRLSDLEGRQLHLARGHTSLYAFCEQELNLTKAQAFTRVQCMRLMRDVPSLPAKLNCGALSLSAAAAVQQCCQKKKVTIARKIEIVEMLSGMSVRAAEQKLVELFPGQPRPEKIKPITPELTRIEFDAPKEMIDDMRELQDLLAHKNFSGSIQKLLHGAIKVALVQARKKKIGAERSRGPRGPRDLGGPGDPGDPEQNRVRTSQRKSSRSPGKRSRHIPRLLRQAVWKRDRGECQYRDPRTGRQCGSTYGVQIDHIRPYARGGAHDLANLQLLCGTHNRWKDGAERPPSADPLA